jgi:cephalosporin-C deacetylase
MKNIYLDAIRAMDVIAMMPEVDSSCIVTFGQSQGGALSVVASAFSGRSKKCYVSEPSYCCLHRRLELGSGVFAAANDYLKRYPECTDAAFDTLTYFDINNIVSFLGVPTDFCLALADPVCLPQFVYSAYAHVNAPKKLHLYPFVPHYTPDEYTNFVHNEFTKL